MAIKKIRIAGKETYEVYVNLRGPNGRLQKRLRGFKSKQAAKQAEFQIKTEFHGERNAPKRWLWQDWVEHYLEREKYQLKASTVQNYAGLLAKWATPYLHNFELEQISSRDIHEIIHTHIVGRSAYSKLTILKTIRRVLNMALEEGVIARNPCNGLKVKVPEPKQAVLNTSEVDKLLHEAAITEHRFYPIWAVAVFTGMRSGELYALKWTDLDFEESKIYVTKAWSSKDGFGPTKSRRNRVVPICESLRKLLQELKLKSGNSDFVLPRLKEWESGEQAKVLREFCRAIGITPVKFHDLRATFITQMLLKNVSLAQVMAIVGHAELKTTNRYLRVAGSDLNGATEKLSFSLPQTELARVIELKPSEMGR